MKSERIIYFIIFGLIAITLCAYFPVVNNSFINYDDPVYITNNNHIKDGLTLDGLKWAFSTFYAANWHPVTWLSHMLDIELFGLEAKAHHLISLIFHIANTLLLFILFYVLSNEAWKSAAVALFFSIHPFHVESVVWAAERKDLLSTFFELLSLILYVKYVRRKTIFKYLLILFFFMLALMSKPMAVSMPVIMLLMDFWPLNRFNKIIGDSKKEKKEVIWFLILEKMPFIFFAILTCIITIFAQKAGDALKPVYEVALNERFSNSICSYTLYLWKTFVPVNFSVFYPHPGNAITTVHLFFSSALLILIIYIVFRKALIYPFIAFGWLWYVITLFPVIGIIQVGNQGYADRYTYIPLVGIFVIITWGWPLIFSKISNLNVFSKVVMALVAVTLISLTNLNIKYWKSSRDVFTHAAEITQNNYVAYNNLGTLMIEEGNFNKAESFFLKALNAKPDYAVGYVNMANAFLLQQKFDLAIDYYKEAIKLNSRDKLALFNLGMAYVATQKLDESIKVFEKIIEQDPEFSQAHLYLGNIYLSRKEIDRAIPFYRTSLKLTPGLVDGHINLGIAMAAKGDMNESVRHLNEALAIDSSNERAKALLFQFSSISKRS